MYFNKIRHPSNFAFASVLKTNGVLPVQGVSFHPGVEELGADVHRLRIPGPEPWHNPSQAELASAIGGETSHRVRWTPEAALLVEAKTTGETLLAGGPGATFGRCGTAWMLQFQHHPEMQFYGLGEHNKGLEKSAQRIKFWNTDLWGDFSLHEIQSAHPNPMYVSIPWLIIKQGNTYMGILVHHPGAVFMDLASNFIWEEKNLDDKGRKSFYVGAPDGEADVYFIVGPDLAALTRKLQLLVGTTPRPPLWALGHHQCRWGYAGPKDLHALDAAFTKHRIPTDGLWLDIDYMERYKVFTFDPVLWGGEERIKRELAALAKKGRRVVPILDPGVKVEPGYAVCEDGLKAGVFCLSPAGKPYVGFVWPGQTYMPDYSLPKTRGWWAKQVEAFARLGASGAWLDMNDPSVGAVELDDMLFDQGRQPHEAYHNQYALGMARASHAGFLAARPDERPFLLARSAYLSSSRYTAVWTGDNCANWHHLRTCIPLSLGLALSGQPFNGPDVAGFGGDTTPELAIAWYKAGFLFPFFRNHAMLDTRHQEPWSLGAPALKSIGHYIRLRYKLLPYLYQLFIAQEETGAAILRPLFHDFSDGPALPLGTISDEFLVGSQVLQAPNVEQGASKRRVVLPAGQHWFAAHEGRWIKGGRTVSTKAGGLSTPLYLREGAVIPMQIGTRTHAKNDLDEIELHCFLKRDTKGVHRLNYRADDGLSFAYRQSQESAVEITAAAGRGGVLELQLVQSKIAWKALRFRVVTYAPFHRVTWRDSNGTQTLETKALSWNFVGKTLRCRISTETLIVKT